MPIRLPKRTAHEPTVQVNVRLRPNLAKELRAFALRNETTMQDVVEAGVRAVIGKKAAA